FDEALKRPLPPFPRRVGVVTSPSGAAIRDVLTVLRRRFPSLPVIIYPVPVQGEGAAPEIARMLQVAGERAECDVLILTRGGGSLEDLWPFNEEVVARAIRACPIPVVSAVGHEIDLTIADLAADLRAATPSAAAELVSPDRAALAQTLAALRRRLLRAEQQQLLHKRHALERLRQRLVHPGHKLRELSQRLDGLSLRLLQAMHHDLERRRARLQQIHSRLLRHSPQQRLGEYRALNRQLRRRLEQAMQQRLEHSRARLRELARALDTVSPLATLERGYAIVTDADSGRVVHSSAELVTGQAVDARLARGAARCRVERLEPPE
ncbi:MAG: exodeoxyribonuclease VII large subunit, partial [Gammaproteobacteria bacterium]